MSPLTFEQLPQAVSDLIEKLDKIEMLLRSMSTPTLFESDQLLTIKDASKFVRLSVPTLYGYVSRNAIPFSKREGSKRLWFSKKELSEWLLEGRKKTIAEIDSEANTYLKKKNRNV